MSNKKAAQIISKSQDLSDKSKQFSLWYDGSEWIISVKGKEQTDCKTLVEWLSGLIKEAGK